MVYIKQTLALFTEWNGQTIFGTIPTAIGPPMPGAPAEANRGHRCRSNPW